MPDQQLNLGFLGNFASGALQTQQANLAIEIANIKSGTSLGLADMIQVQTDLSAFSIFGNLCSSIVKEVSDTLKSAIRNVN
jgi:hypothetical protein